MSRAVLCLVALLLGVPVASAQVDGVTGGVVGGVVPAPRPDAPPRDTPPPATGHAIVRGRVLTADTGQPLRRASVRLAMQGGQGGRAARTTITDADGRFEFRDIAAGRFLLDASKSTFLSRAYGQTYASGPGKPLTLADNQTVENIEIRLPRGAVITGRIFDEFGDPIANARVTLMRQQFMQGQRRLMGAGGGGNTNDLGEYRIFGLAPAQYFVSVSAQPDFGPNFPQLPPGDSEPRMGFAPTFYPGVSEISAAKSVKVDVAQTLTEVNITLLSMRLARISGTAMDAQGHPLTGGGVTVVPRDLAAAGVTGGGSIRQDGTFTVQNVPPGEYVLRAMKPPIPISGGRPGPPEFSIARVSVNGADIDGVQLMPIVPVTIAGRIVFDDPAAAQSMTTSMLRVFAPPVNPQDSMAFGPNQGQPAAVNDDLTFQVAATPGRVALRTTAAGWSIKAIHLNGVDVTDTGLEADRNIRGVEIELTKRTQTVTGKVSDGRGQAVGDYAVLLFAQDRAKWTAVVNRYVTSVRIVGNEEPFKNTFLAPGLYFAIALDHLDTSDWQDPQFLESLTRDATPFSLGEGATATLDLRLFTIR